MPVSGCYTVGLPLYWASSKVSWDIQKDGSSKRHISAETLRSVVESAFSKWQNVECPGGKPSISLEPYGDGYVECAKPEYNQTQPNANVITFHDDTWPYEELGAETLALTTVYFSAKTGEIYDANVEINSNQQEFALSDAASTEFDLNAVLTHELGHFLGLSHTIDQNATMFSNYQPGMSTLEADDEAAICDAFPPGRQADTDSDTPRHGFSSQCSGPEGCCASTIGGKVPPSGAVGLWLFGLGATAWIGRARFKRSARALRR